VLKCVRQSRLLEDIRSVGIKSQVTGTRVGNLVSCWKTPRRQFLRFGLTRTGQLIIGTRLLGDYDGISPVVLFTTSVARVRDFVSGKKILNIILICIISFTSRSKKRGEN